MDQEIKDKYIRAGKIAGEVRDYAKKITKPGKKILDIAEAVEALIKAKGAEIAFPINISINDIAAHDTADRDDERIISENDVVKLDVGTHIDGYIGDTACTVAWLPEHQELIKATERALEEAIKLCTPGANLGDISAIIEKTITDLGFKPIANLTGHGLGKYNLHAEPTIPNVGFKTSYTLQEEQPIAIEPFATIKDGAGLIKESTEKKIFMLINPKPVRNQNARQIIKIAEKRNGLPFPLRWVPASGIGLRIGLKELMDKNILYDYPVLKEVNTTPIAQSEQTIIVGEKPMVTTKTDNF